MAEAVIQSPGMSLRQRSVYVFGMLTLVAFPECGASSIILRYGFAERL